MFCFIVYTRDISAEKQKQNKNSPRTTTVSTDNSVWHQRFNYFDGLLPLHCFTTAMQRSVVYIYVRNFIQAKIEFPLTTSMNLGLSAGQRWHNVDPMPLVRGLTAKPLHNWIRYNWINGAFQNSICGFCFACRLNASSFPVLKPKLAHP